MALITVNSLNDGAVDHADDATVLTLRDAIDLAQNMAGDDQIVFASNLTGNITLTSGRLQIVSGGGALSINGDTNGDGNPDITLVGSGDQHITNSAALSLQSLRFTGGSYANGVYGGGSITNQNGGNLTIANSDFSGNSASATNSAQQTGYMAAGAIFNEGTLNITQSTLTGGSAGGGRGGFGISGTGYTGGGAASGIVNTGTLTISHTVTEAGSATGGTGGQGDNGAGMNNGYNGGTGGAAVHGILNLGTITANSGVQNRNPGILSGGAGGAGGAGTPGYANGNPGATGGTFAGNAGNLTNLSYEANNGTSGADVVSFGDGASFYGLNGNDVISAGYSSTINGGAGNDTLTAVDGSTVFGGIGNDTIICNDIFNGTWSGGAGIDTLDASAHDTTDGSVFDLSAASFIINSATFSGFENIFATQLNDFIIDRNSTINNINGGAGNDTVQMSYSSLGDIFSGGGGINTLVQNAAGLGSNIVVNLVTGFVTNSSTAGQYAAFSNFQNVSVNGGMGIVGNGQNNVLIGISTNAGNSVNNFDGGAGDDTLRGGLGGDTLNGGSNTIVGDTVDYSTSAAAVEVDLDLSFATGGDATNDSISNFENVIGSDHADKLTASSARNSLFGGLGADRLFTSGTFGDVAGEVFDGGADTDTLILGGVLGAPGTITHNFRNDSLVSIEALTLIDPSADVARNILLNANQFGGTGIASNAVINLDSFTDTTEVFDIAMGAAASLSLANITFAGTSSTARFVVTGDGDAETITGSSLNDTLNGMGGNDTIAIVGAGIGSGRDTIDGGADTDTLDLTNATQFAWVNLAYNGDEVQTRDGVAWRGLANMTGVENVKGTAFGDQIFGDGNVNALFGGGGNDTIYGRSGNDRLEGGADSDALYGEAGQDTLYADGGNDVLNGGSEDDTFIFSTVVGNLLDFADGGLGNNDRIDCSAFTEIAWVDLAAVGTEVYTKTAGGAAWLALANLSNIENVIGSNQNDEMYGDANNNRFEGGNGNDKLDGRGGYDTLIGGNGNDTLTGGDLSDTLDGGADNDTFVFSSTLTGLDTVEGGTGNDTADCSAFATKAWVDLAYAGAEVQTFNGAWKAIANTNSVENVIGSAVADELYGNTAANTMSGGGASDLIQGRTGADILTGGTGSDMFKFALGDSGQTQATLDTITDYAKGAVGTGDKIDFIPALSIGGTGATATASQAQTNFATAVATFAAGSGTTLADALADIDASFTAGGNAAGEFALFRVNNAGATYMLVSDGVAGIGANDVLIQLTGVTSVGSINLTGGDLTILT